MTDGIAGLPANPAQAQLALAQAVCSRLCHDLGGPVGALSGALEMLGEPGDDAAEVAVDAARIIDRRLRFWRAAVGGPGPVPPGRWRWSGRWWSKPIPARRDRPD